MFEYAVLTTLYWAAFYGLYALVLRRNTFFQLNRWYLLGALAAGMALPLLKDINLQWGPQEEPVLYMAPVVEGFEFIYNLEAVVIASPAAFPWKAVLAAVYLLGAGFCLLRLLAGLYRLRRLRAGSELEYVGGNRIAYTSSAHLPFSFGRTIYMSRQTRWAPEEEAGIISHERAHIRDGHTMDVLALELLGVVFWFSPPLYMYRRALRLQHEYIADAIVLRTRARSDYGRLLIRQALPGLHPYIAHSFHSSLKQRISMMTKTQSNPGARWLYLAAAPLAFGLVLLFSQRSAIAAALPELSTLLVYGDQAEADEAPEAPAPVLQVETSGKGGDPDVMPVFAGCENEPLETRKACSDRNMLEHVYRNLSYPEAAREAGIRGTVVSRFTVSATGEVTNLEIVKDIGGGCGDEVLRVLKSMPRWTPGMKEGKPVAVTLNLPVRFSLPDYEKAEEFTADHSIIYDGGKNEMKTSIEGTPTVVGNAVKIETGQPLVFINGKKTADGKKVMAEVNPDQIKSIEAMKGEQAIEYAGEEGKHGVILITLYADGEKPVSAPAPPPPSSALSTPTGVFKVVEEMPRFPGCEDASLQIVERKNCADRKMLEFIYHNLRYPALARENGIEGTVVISYIVDTDGSLKDIKAVRGIGGGCEEEVVRIVNLMPRWIPGRQKGEDVAVQFNLPVRFKLDADPPANTAPAGSQALKVEDFKLFPNPSEGKFTLQFKAPEKPTHIQVRDMQGRVVLTRNLGAFPGTFREELDLGRSPKGDYVVVISQGELVFTANYIKL